MNVLKLHGQNEKQIYTVVNAERILSEDIEK